MEQLLKVLSNTANQGILHLLRTEASYARKIANLLDLKESEVTRRLRTMEGLGLVKSAWKHIGKNVKLYSLAVEGISVRFGAQGLHVEVDNEGGTSSSSILDPGSPTIPPSDALVGRDEQMKLLLQGPAVVLVEGMPGIGKTTLMATAARSMEGRHVFWHSFRGIESLAWLANRLGVWLSHHDSHGLLEAVQQDADLVDKREIMLQAVNDSRFALFFDDVHLIEDELVKQFLLDCAATMRDGRMRLASRKSLPVIADTHVAELQLEGLADKFVRQLLDDDGATTSDEMMPRLRALFGGHPLALHLSAVASKQNSVPLAQLLDRIQDVGLERSLEDFLLREIYERLGDGERRLLTAASVFRTQFKLEDVQAISAKTLYEKDLLSLRRQYLVQDRLVGHGLHEIVRTFFYAQLDDPAVLHKKLAKQFLARGTTEGRIEAMHHYLAGGERSAVLKLLRENLDLREFDFIDAGYTRMYLKTLELFTEQEVNDPHQWALIEDEKGDIQFSRGQYKEALEHYDRANAHFMEHKDGTEDEDIAWKRAMCMDKLGQSETAKKIVAEALADAPAEGRARDRLVDLQQKLTQ